jgi:hypothetical protein
VTEEKRIFFESHGSRIASLKIEGDAELLESVLLVLEPFIAQFIKAAAGLEAGQEGVDLLAQPGSKGLRMARVVS